MGGAQAVGALAYGTASVPRVDKIVGPGNIYVATAKRMVFGAVGIDMVAGPSEILVVCDGNTSPDWIAMDLFSQAEHDEEAQSILVCPDADFIEQVKHHAGGIGDTAGSQPPQPRRRKRRAEAGVEQMDMEAMLGHLRDLQG